ncbi:MAG: cyclic nucleotide-binding domain-containing protein [Gammaproteobacteria bacterium]|nr:cyclic nucleotide-binding domain-containing protein [Gammaproteobacteria bacterium]
MKGQFRFLTAEDTRLLYRKAQLARLSSGQLLIREGAVPAGIFVLQHGSVDICRCHGGQDIIVSTLRAGALVGENALLKAGPATASVRAREATDCLVFTEGRLLPLFASNPWLAGRFYQSIAYIISQRLRRLNLEAGGDPFTRRFGRIPDWELI